MLSKEHLNVLFGGVGVDGARGVLRNSRHVPTNVSSLPFLNYEIGV